MFSFCLRHTHWQKHHFQRLNLHICFRRSQKESEVKASCLKYKNLWHIFYKTEVEFWHVWEFLAVGGYFMPVSLNEFWWAAVVRASLTVPTSLCSFPVFMSDPQQPTGEALSAVRSESHSVWSTSNIFEQFRQGWVQVIQSLPEECFGEMRRRPGSQEVAEKPGLFIPVFMHTTKLPISMADIFKWTPNVADTLHLENTFELSPSAPRPSPLFHFLPLLRQ